MKKIRKPYKERLPSKLVACDICGKEVRERGLNAHKRLEHITQVKPVITQVKPIITKVKPEITQVKKPLTQVITQKTTCDCSKYPLVNHPYLKAWNDKEGIHIHTQVCSNCGRFEEITQVEYFRRLGLLR